MVAVGTARLSSKGQAVIPEKIRTQLGLKTGCEFVIVANDRGDMVWKVIERPDSKRFDALLAEARKSAKRAGLTQRDVQAAIRRVRRARRTG